MKLKVSNVFKIMQVFDNTFEPVRAHNQFCNLLGMAHSSLLLK